MKGTHAEEFIKLTKKFFLLSTSYTLLSYILYYIWLLFGFIYFSFLVTDWLKSTNSLNWNPSSSMKPNLITFDDSFETFSSNIHFSPKILFLLYILLFILYPSNFFIRVFQNIVHTFCSYINNLYMKQIINIFWDTLIPMGPYSKEWMEWIWKGKEELLYLVFFCLSSAAISFDKSNTFTEIIPYINFRSCSFNHQHGSTSTQLVLTTYRNKRNISVVFSSYSFTMAFFKMRGSSLMPVSNGIESILEVVITVFILVIHL